MVDYITRADILRSAGTLAEQASILRKSEARSPQGSTFLSHASKDAELLPGVIAILERHGASVYIDKKDDSLPPTTSRTTAAILRGRINQCKKFILLTTKSSKDSLWVPWELGVADGYKRNTNLAIFPGVDSATDRTWAEREYLGLYDRIVFGQLEGQPTSVFMVWDQEKNTATELSQWLRS